jgi:urea transport system permease protein
VLPSGFLGLFSPENVAWLRSRFGFTPKLSTYPSLEEDLEVQNERKNLTD